MGFMDSFEIKLEDNTEQHTGYYCSVCDAVSVKPNMPETGKFFKMFGTCMDKAIGYIDGRDDEYEIGDREDNEPVSVYTPIKFAICTNCFNK